MRTLVLSGGGSSGCFQAGVLYQIFNELKFDNVYGTSAGGLNAVIFAQCIINKNPDLLKKIWTEDIKNDKVVILKNYIKSIFLDYPYDFKPLLKLIRNNINIKDLCNLKEKITLMSTDLKSGQSFNVNNHQVNPEDFEKGMLASASIPPVFEPVSFGDKMLVDGGIRENIPLKQMEKEAEEELNNHIVVVLCSPLNINISAQKEFNLLKNGLRTIEIMTNEITNNDIRSIVEINNLLKKLKKYIKNDEEFKQITNKKILDIDIIAPKEPLELGVLDFNQETLKRGFSLGRIRADRYIKEVLGKDGIHFLSD